MTSTVSPRGRGISGSRKHPLLNPFVIFAVLAFSGFGALWILVIVPDFLEATFFQNMNPVPAYIVYNIGAISLTTGFFGFFVGSILLGQKFHFLQALKLGIVSFIIFSFAWDMIEPPFYLSPSGHVLIPLGGAALENTAVDAMTAYVWTSLFPILANTAALFIAVYLVTPIFAMILCAFLLKPKMFVKFIASGGR